MDWKSYPSQKPKEGEIVLVYEQFIRECDGKHISRSEVAVFVKARFNQPGKTKNAPWVTRRRNAFVNVTDWVSGDRDCWLYAHVTHWCYIDKPKNTAKPANSGGGLVQVITKPPKERSNA